jgi:hypothetical protein
MGDMHVKRMLASVLLGLLVGALPAAERILVEAESFTEKGGWVVDQQFMDVMGSPFLLAHGLGRPVKNATTSFTVPKDGAYRVWVRTRNWVPGDWEAPGRFRVLVNDRELKPEFGTEDGWAWQDGGQVDLKAGAATLVLKDLTGFDGRCDAIFLTTGANERPPNKVGEMRSWRNKLRGLPDKPAKTETYDLVIVGGGIAGCGAALAAGEQGLNVVLIHDRPILGGNASGEIRVHTIGIPAHAVGFLSKINTKHWPNGSPEALKDDVKRHWTMESAKGVKLFLMWRAYDVAMDGKRIKAVYAQHTETGVTQAFEAPVFVDSTGDGWIGYWAGADFRYGREAKAEFDEGWDKHGDLWSPAKPDNRVMGSSLLWYAKPAKNAERFPEVPWALPVANGNKAIKGEWYYEFSRDDLHQIKDAEVIRDHMLRAIYGSFANAQKTAKYANYRLDFVGYLSGKRESRRLMGDYIYTMKDMKEGRDFPDAVCEEKRDIDVHYQRKYKSDKYPYDFLSTALFVRVPRYKIPFRSLYSRNIENLMMAGRCFSCSHVGLGGPRVMNTTGQMGVAVGYAASLCKKYDATPREVCQKHIEQLVQLTRHGAPAGDQTQASGPAMLQIAKSGGPLLRTAGGYTMSPLPESLRNAVRIVPVRGEMRQPGAAYRVKANQPVVAYLGVHERGNYAPPKPWEKTDLSIVWEKGKDRVFRHEFPAGEIAVPAHTGKNEHGQYGLPNVLLLVPADAKNAANLKVEKVE